MRRNLLGTKKVKEKVLTAYRRNAQDSTSVPNEPRLEIAG